MGVTPLIEMPGSPQNWMVINHFNFEIAQLELDTTNFSDTYDHVAILRAELFNMKSQVGPGFQHLQASIYSFSKMDKKSRTSIMGFGHFRWGQ